MAQITEGAATINFPDGQVFYNPVQEFNRDLSITAIKAYQTLFPKKELKILEALSATGLRAIRYSKELDNVQVLANDIDPTAVELIKSNIELNQAKVETNLGDACLLMFNRKNFFDVIDLDPYGSASPFIEAAIQSIVDGGMICITCTDMAVLCGSHPESCFSKYGSVPLKSSFCHEQALRIVLSMTEAAASKNKKFIVPLLSASIDFYVRIFVQVFTSPKEAKLSMTKNSFLLQCVQCHSFNMQPLGRHVDGKFTPNIFTGSPQCEICQGRIQLGGPIWNSNLHSIDFLKQILSVLDSCNLKTKPRILGLVSVLSEELQDPLFWSISSLSNVLKCVNPSLLTFNSAVLNAGYKVSISHCCPLSVKTNAPSKVIWDIMRSWVKEHPVSLKSENICGSRILSVGPSLQVSFIENPLANPPSRKIKLVRFQENPLPNWGPKAKAKRLKTEE